MNGSANESRTAAGVASVEHGIDQQSYDLGKLHMLEALMVQHLAWQNDLRQQCDSLRKSLGIEMRVPAARR